MANDGGTDRKTIRNYALKFLSYRPRTIHEVRARLLERSYASELVDETVEWLQGLGYLNDKLLAEEFAASGLATKLWGPRKIAFMLGRKGVPAGTVDEAVSSLDKEAQLSSARRAIGKWQSKRGLTPPLDRDDRIKGARYLDSRGFTTGVIHSVLDESGRAYEI